MSWLPGFFLRRFFSKQWLATHTRIDVRPRHYPVSVRGGELPEVNLWLIVANHGHFDIELDRLSGEFIFGSAITRFHYLKRTELKPNVEVEIFIRASLTADQVAHISRNKERPFIALQLQAEFNSKIHNFSVDTGQLTGIQPDFLNV